MTDSVTARDMAERLLAKALPRRWAHVQGVAGRASEVADHLGHDSEILISAAWLHDIGYAPNLVETGFHPLDGARFLRGEGVSSRVVDMVAHHSCATLEARVRGLEAELSAEFVREESPAADALCFCDMTTGPDGQRVEVESRLDEIRSRYGPDDIVTRFIDSAEPCLLAAVNRTERRLPRAGTALHPT